MYVTEKALLTDAVYGGDYQFFPPRVLEEALRTEVSTALNQKESKNHLFRKINQSLDTFRRKGLTAKDEEWASCDLLVSDLENLRENVSGQDNTTDIRENLDSVNADIVGDINRFLGLDYVGVPVYVNDYLPSPFTGLGWLAANVRPNDPSGLPVGIYLAGVFMSKYSEFLLYHENVHVAIEPKDANHHYVLWFDEGVADVLSAIYLARKRGDWEKWVCESIRKRQKPDYNSRIRAWNDRVIAHIIATYGMDFLRFLLNQRKHNPRKVKWHQLYDCVRSGRSTCEMYNCFADDIRKEKFEPSGTDIEKKVCSLFLTRSPERIVLHPISYRILKEYLHTDRSKGKFFRVTYEELSRMLGKIDSPLLKTYSKHINGILSVGADNIGLKAWDTVGYYRNTNEYNLVFADASVLRKYLGERQ